MLGEDGDIARERRDVYLVDAGDGMVDLGARLPALVGTAILDRLTQAAKGMSLPTYSPYWATKPLRARAIRASRAGPAGSRQRASQ